MFLRAITKAVVAGFTIISLILYSVLPAYGLTFSDTSGYWARNSIARLAALEIVNGFGGQFHPQAGVTRAEFAAMIVRALGLAGEAEVVRGIPTGYTDVAAGHWAAGDIIVAREMGLINGYPDGSFKPSAQIRRVEITSILVRALELESDEKMKDPQATFTDGSQIAVWAYDAVKTACNYDLINGYPDGSFGPERNATRGETAALIEKLLKQMGAEYTFSGILQSTNVSANLLTMEIIGQMETFAVSSQAEVWIDNNEGSISNLKSGSQVSIILDDNGVVKFIQASEPALLSQSIDEVLPLTLSFKDDTAGIALGAEQGFNLPRKDLLTAIMIAKDGYFDQVYQTVKNSAGMIDYINKDISLLIADITNEVYLDLKKSYQLEWISVDKEVKVESLTAGSGSEGEPLTNVMNPGRSLSVAKKEINAPEFVELTNSDGKHQTIAIIDTGVDPGHPDLQLTSHNQRKIVDWQDFTGEGDIDTSSVAVPNGKYLNLADGEYQIGDIASISGKFRYGYLREIDLVNAGGNSMDINFNENASDIFGIIVVDSKRNGGYDTVYVDTNMNKDFSDEQPLTLFSLNHIYGTFMSEEGKDSLNFVLTKVDSGGALINLGFDGNDHGTHVAGIAGANGKIKGVAPGAQIMALKVLDSGGYGDRNLSSFVKAMSYAAEHGADIINMSLGFPVSADDDDGVLTQIFDALIERYGVVFVVAAGNQGPGLTTVISPADSSAAISVGAFSSPQIWKTDYGWNVPEKSLWFFSAAGPRLDGSKSPSIVAPGSALSSVPLRNGELYSLSEGTSMAVPYVTGSIALLMEVADRNNINASPAVIKKALEYGAQPIPGYGPAEQGHGALNVVMSWAAILSIDEIPNIGIETTNPGLLHGSGIFIKEGIPKKLTVQLKNNSDRNFDLKLNNEPWVDFRQNEVNIASGQRRTVDLQLNSPEEKGLFSFMITGDDSSTYGKDAEILTTIINPYYLTENNKYRVKIEDEQNAAQYKRYFFKVPPGAEAVTAKITVDENRGRSMVYLYNPSGRLVSESGYAGNNPGAYVAEAAAVGGSPSAGVWEAVVYTSAALSAYDLNQSNYDLEVSLKGQDIGKYKYENRKLIVGVVPKVITPGRKNLVTVQVRDRYTKKPFEGFIEINGMLYFTRGGRAIIPAEADGLNVTLRVSTVPGAPDIEPWELDFTLPVDNGP